MASPRGKTKGEKPKPESVEVEPDAWERFERAVKTIVKTKPKQAAAQKRSPAKHR